MQSHRRTFKHLHLRRGHVVRKYRDEAGRKVYVCETCRVDRDPEARWLAVAVGSHDGWGR